MVCLHQHCSRPSFKNKLLLKGITHGVCHIYIIIRVLQFCSKPQNDTNFLNYRQLSNSLQLSNNSILNIIIFIKMLIGILAMSYRYNINAFCK